MTSGMSKEDRSAKQSTFEAEKVSSEVSEENLKSVAKNLLTRSSVYAVAQLVTSNGFGRKFLWLLVLVLGLIGCSYEVYRFLSLYFQYPVVITLEVENSWKLEFPAVTVCNLNRIPIYYYNCIQENKSIEECIALQCEEKGRSFSTMRPVITSERQKFASCSNDFDGVFSDQRMDQLQFLNRYLSMSKEDRREVGYKVDSFIESCTYNGESCSSSNFSDFLSIEFGNCFTFNAKSDPSMKPLQTPYIGPNSGLEITLNLQVADYVPISSSIGARIVIHESHTRPNPEDYGVNISPGFETSVAIQQSSIHRLPDPYRDKCKKYDEESLHFPRNQEDCIRKCMQSENFRQCGCEDPFFPADYSSELCDLRNQTLVCCLDQVMKSLSTDATPCPCPLPCKSVYYDMTMSTAEWPSFQFYKEFMKPKEIISPCKNESVPTTDPDEHYSEIKRQSAKLKVFYKTLEKSYYKQEPMFQESELFSQLGGQLGLWLGVSLVALFECIENVSHLLHYCIKKSGMKNKPLQPLHAQKGKSTNV